MKRNTRIYCLLTFLLFFVSPPHLGAEQPLFLEESSTDDVMYLKGIIGSVSIEKMQISVRPLKGRRVVIDITPDTQIAGISKMEELMKKQQVKIWYQYENKRNIALKIEKLPDLGC